MVYMFETLIGVLGRPLLTSLAGDMLHHRAPPLVPSVQEVCFNAWLQRSGNCEVRVLGVCE